MNKAKPCKLTLFLLCFAAFLLAAVCLFAARTSVAEAASVKSPSNYFTGSDVLFEDDNVTANVKTGEFLEFKNKLAINNAAFKFEIPANLSELKITLTSDPFHTAGAVKEGEFFTSVDNVITLTAGELSLNDESAAGAILAQGEFTVELKITDNVLSVKAGGVTVVNTDEFYKIGDEDRAVAKVRLDFTVDGDDAVKFGIAAVDQNVGEAGYEQTFALNESGEVNEIAKPRISLGDTFKKVGANEIVALKGNMYSVSFKAYSVFGSAAYSDSGFYIKVDENDADKVWLENSAKPKKVAFYEDVTVVVTDGTVDAESFDVSVKVKADDVAAPVYGASEYAINAYKAAVIKAAEADYDEDGKGSVRLGESYEIPSMANLVSDDLTPYASLKKTVYYKTPSNGSGTSENMKISLSEAGDYEFYVVFADQAGNSMEKDDFYTFDEGDGNIVVAGTYYGYVFTFHIEDDAPILVTANSETQASGYLNTKYTATAFTVKSSGNTTTYTLYYNPSLTATEDAEGWVKIPQKADVSTDYDSDGFTYDDVSAIDYDGSLTFTPVKLGSYKIECVVTSDNSVRSSSAAELIVVDREPNVVKVPSHWFRDNVWSVVFLGIGTLSLIGIIVLLFVKPKEETEKDETGKAYKKSVSK